MPEGLDGMSGVWGFSGSQTGHSWSLQGAQRGFGYLGGVSAGLDGDAGRGWAGMG